MAKSNIYTPEGVQDFLYKSCKNKRNIESKLRKLFSSFGYKEIETPIIEFYDVFTRSNTSYRVENMFKIFDEKGRVLVLKPDQTIPVARVAATKLQKKEEVNKVSYIVNTFRFDEQGGGKQRQFTQAGCELINADGVLADVEIIALAINSLLENGIEDFQIDIGNVNIFRGLLENTNCSDEDIEEVRRLIDSKDFTGLEDMLNSIDIEDSLKNIIKKLPANFGDMEMLKEIKKEIKNDRALEAINKIEDIYVVLDEYGFSKYVSLDLGMVSGHEYYTGLIFKGYTYGVGFPILSGGRYDKLLGKFGKDMGAVGFSVGVNFLMMAKQRQNKMDKQILCDTYISFDKKCHILAFEISNALRKQGLKIEQALKSEKIEEAKDHCQKNDINGFIHIMSEEKILVFDIIKDTVVETSLKELTGKEEEN